MATDLDQRATPAAKNSPSKESAWDKLTTARSATQNPQRQREQAEARKLYTPGNILAVTVWFGLLGGIIEGGHWTYKQLFAPYLVFFPREVFWMSCLAVLSIAAIPGVLCAITATVFRKRGVFLAAVALTATVAAVNSLIIFVKLQMYAHILLGFALGTVVARLFGKSPQRAMKIVRGSVVWLVLIAFGFMAAQMGHLAWLRQSATANRVAAPADSPNVVLLVLDTVRADALASYGADPEMTPNLHRWSQRGVVFDHAWSTGPWTLPSQAGMFTGRLPSEITASWACRLSNRYPILAQELAANGWETGGFVANTMYCGEETGVARGFDHYDDYPITAGQTAMCSAIFRKFINSTLPTKLGYYGRPSHKTAQDVNRAALRWLDARDEERPFFLFLNYLDAHDPYFAPDAFRREEKSHQDKMILRSWWWRRKERLTPEQATMAQRAYEDCLKGLDEQVGRFLADLEERGKLKNTILIITADHGEHFGEHNLYLHGNSLYEPLIRVPLIVIGPKDAISGKRISQPVSLAELPATVMQMAGLQAKSPFPGASWNRYLGNNPAKPTPLFAETMRPPRFSPCHGHSPIHRGAMRTVRLNEYKYIRNGDGIEELYNVVADPLEEKDLSSDPRYLARLERLRALLDARLKTPLATPAEEAAAHRH